MSTDYSRLLYKIFFFYKKIIQIMLTYQNFLNCYVLKSIKIWIGQTGLKRILIKFFRNTSFATLVSVSCNFLSLPCKIQWTYKLDQYYLHSLRLVKFDTVYLRWCLYTALFPDPKFFKQLKKFGLGNTDETAFSANSKDAV